METIYDVFINPDKLWPMFLKHRDYLREHRIEIASNHKVGTTITFEEDAGSCKLTVFLDDKEIDCENVYTSEKAKEIYATMLEEYVEQEDEDVQCEDADEYTEEDRAELAAEVGRRDAELKRELSYFLEVALDHDMTAKSMNAISEELLDPVLKAIAEQSYAVYAPCFVVDPSGQEYYDEYPY